MHSTKALVKNGRLVLDEPTDRPDGEVVELVPIDEVVAAAGDGLDDEEREQLRVSLRESVEQMERGQTIDADEALATLRARR